MNRLTVTAVLLALVVLGGHDALAQNGYDLFQKGLVQEQVDGNLEEAIRLYKQIVAEHKDDRTLVAKALVQMGACYEKLGRAEARKAYEQVVSEYADQTQAVSTARSRLSVLDQVETTGKPSDGVTVRQVWKDQKAGGTWAVSPNGRYFTFVDYSTGDLAVHELATATNRRLTSTGGWNKDSGEGVVEDGLLFSPDSSRIAYAWRNQEKGVDLRIVDLDASEPLVLCRGTAGKSLWPLAWSPNGKEILVALPNGQIGLVSVSVGSQRVLESLTENTVVDTVVRFSPDGSNIVYNSPQEKDSLNADVFLFALDGGARSNLVQHPANDRVLGWTPDGKGVLFVSDRRGTIDAWLVQVADGKPQGEPQLIKSDLGQIIPLGFTQNGSFYYRISSLEADVYVATLDLKTGSVVEPPKKVSLRREGSSSSPDWSPDGKYLAYISQRFGSIPDRARIIIQNVETGEYRELSTSLQNIRMKGARWSPDGRSFILHGFKGTSGSGGIYKVDAQTGQESLIRKGWAGQPEWTADGKGIVFVQGSNAGTSRIMLRELETGQERELATASRGDMEQMFALSPDGRQLAFTSCDADTKSVALNIVSVDAGEPRELLRVPQGESIGRLGFAPDGSQVLFEKEAKEGTALWRVPVEGGTAQASGLVAKGWGGAGYLFPRMHPDGRRIAFTGSSPMIGEVWAMENFLPKPEPKPSNSPTVRQVWKDPRVNVMVAVSPCDRYLALAGMLGDLTIRDLTTGTERTLAKGSWNEGGFGQGVAGNVVFSPDSSRIACPWLNKEMGVDLRIVGLDASEPLVLCRGERGMITSPIAWSPDGSDILVTVFSSMLATVPRNSHYALVSVSDGSSRVLDSLTRLAGDVCNACFSPDGKHIVYDSRREEESPNADVFLYTLEGGAHSRLVEHPANDKALGWTPDGRGILFISDRRGAYDVWLVPVADGRSQGEPRLIKSDLGHIVPLGFSRNGSYYYNVASRAENVFVATLDVETGEVVEQPKKVSLRREGSSSSPDWSPDGKYLAYISQRFGGIPDHAKIVIQNVETGEYRELSTSMWNIRLKGARWSPDGRSFILYGFKGTSGSSGIYQVDAQTGQERLIRKGLDGHQPEWTADGKGIIFAQPKDSASNHILLRDLETGQERELAVASRGEIEQMFALSPDGRRLAFTTVRKDTESVVLNVVPVAGGEPRELTRVKLPEKIGRLEWVPDGSQVLFEKKVKEGTALWRVPVEGGAAQASGLVAKGYGGFAGGYLFPRMHPDGRRIAFSGSSSSPMVGEVWVMENFLPAAGASAEKQ